VTACQNGSSTISGASLLAAVVLLESFVHALLRHQRVAVVGVRVGSLETHEPRSSTNGCGLSVDPQVEHAVRARPGAPRRGPLHD
jgi:hypothetical protein